MQLKQGNMARTRGAARRSPSPVTDSEDRESQRTESEDVEAEERGNVVREEEGAESEEAQPQERGNMVREEVAAGSEEPVAPVRFYFEHSKWLNICKIATRCDLKQTVELIERKLQSWELDWFRTHPQFKHYFHMPRHENRRLMGMWMLLLRTVNTSRTKECWFVVNGVPVCYSIAEHALISGLKCIEYPEGHNQLGSLDFVERCFNRHDHIDVIDIREKLESMDVDSSGEERIKLALLYFLTTIIKGKSKTRRGYIEEFLLRIVDDLDVCQSFPWGTFSFLNVLEEVEHLVEHFDGEVQGTWTFPGFILPLEVLAYESIPSLDNKFRKEVVGADKSCPRLCKRMFKRLNHKGIPLGDVYDGLGETKNIISPQSTPEEFPLLELNLGGHPDDVTDTMPESWVESLVSSSEGVYWKDLYDMDVAMRAELVVEDEPAEEFKEFKDAKVAEVSVDERLEKFKEEMKNKFKEFKDDVRKTYEAKYRDFKEDMKNFVEGLVYAEYRKMMNATRRGSTYEVGESSRKDEDEDVEEVEEPDFDEHTPMAEIARNLARENKRRKMN